jgi:hypothetical protein
VKRLLENQVVGLSVGETTVDCRVAGLMGGEAALHPVRPAEAKLLPAASAGAELVFAHRGGLVMLRGAMYRAGSPEELRFAEGTRATCAVPAEQRRRAARVDIALLASVTPLAQDGTPEGDEHQFFTRDVSIGGFALDTRRVPMVNGSLLRFTVTLPDLTQVGGTGRVVRAARGLCGVQFEDVAPADRLKLAGFLVAQQRARPAAA